MRNILFNDMRNILFKMMARKKLSIKKWTERNDIQDLKSLIPKSGFQINNVLHDKFYV